MKFQKNSILSSEPLYFDTKFLESCAFPLDVGDTAAQISEKDRQAKKLSKTKLSKKYVGHNLRSISSTW